MRRHTSFLICRRCRRPVYLQGYLTHQKLSPLETYVADVQGPMALDIGFLVSEVPLYATPTGSAEAITIVRTCRESSLKRERTPLPQAYA